MKILIGGDVIPTPVNFDLFEKSDLDALMGIALKRIWQDADFRIINLEAPFTDAQTPIAKLGPNLRAPKKTFPGLMAMKPSLVGLANNHVLDFGAQGLRDTMEILGSNDISYAGAGENLGRAHKPFIFNADDKTIGVYACAEHEFTIADKDSPGANPFDPLYSLDHISELKQKCDYVIVTYHGGKEYYRYPSPRLKEVCRKIAQKGADLVLCQHSHCIGSMERYAGATIVYGQGNFIFAKDYVNEYLYSGLLVSLDLSAKNKIEFIPVHREGKGIRLAEGEKGKEILEAFAQRSEEIKKEGFIEERYDEFAREMSIMYMNKMSGRRKAMIRLDNLLFKDFFIKKRYSGIHKLMLKNYIQCEAHRELVLRGLEKNKF